MIKSQKATMNLDIGNIDSIKLVKNSTVFAKDGFVYAVHYGKTIFQHNMNTHETIIDLNCSTTSNRLIRRCLDFYNINEQDAINIHEGSKWNYSEALV